MRFVLDGQLVDALRVERAPDLLVATIVLNLVGCMLSYEEFHRFALRAKLHAPNGRARQEGAHYR